MSDKINLDDVASGYNLSKINVNFDKIETELNEKVLYRDPPDGAPNEMSTDLDMNGNKIYNLAKPTSPHEPLRLIDAAEIAAGGEFPISTTISSSGSGTSLVRSPEGVIRSLTGVGHIQTVIDGDDMLITTTAEANTAASIGTGTSVYASKVGSDLQFKSLKAGANVSIADSGTEIIISSIGVSGGGEANTASNVGTGTGVFRTKSGVDLQFKTLKAGTNVTLNDSGTEVTINSTSGSGTGEINTASNVGTGAGVFKAKTGVDLAFKSLKAGSNITLTPSADEILIASSGSGSATLPVKTILDFGAIGDGVTDNTAAFTAAVAWIISNKLPVFIPAGHYKTGPFSLYTGSHQDWCGFYGEDPKRTIIQDIGTSSGPLITIGSAAMTAYAGYFKFSNITVQANGTSGSAFRTYDLAWTEFDNCYFQGGATAFECYGGVNITFNNCGFQFAATGLLVTSFSRAGGGWPNNIKLNGGIVGNNSQRGIFFDYGRQLLIDGTQIEGNGSIVGNSAHGGIIVGTNIGAETGTQAVNAHSGVVGKGIWFEQNTGIADAYFQSGFNALTDCMFWSQPSIVTNNVRVTGQKYNLVSCDFAQTSFTSGQPNVFEGSSVMSGNVIVGGDIPQITWSNQKTSMFLANTLFAPAATVAGPISAASSITAGTNITASGTVQGANVTATGTVTGATVTSTGNVNGVNIAATNSLTTRSLNVAPLWNAFSGNTPTKPVILFGYDAFGASTTVSFGRTMANNGTIIIAQPVAVADTYLRAPLVTGVTTTGFSLVKERISGTTKSTENYGVYWIAIGEEA